MLELAAAYPMHTQQRRVPNLFVPDAQMLFHVLGLCDQMMLSTDRFIRSAPAWLPIISQLYIAVLWNVMILRVYVNSGYGAFFSQLLDDLISHLRIDECMIPGPLVPFFQALGAINGPFDWMGDILPALPDFTVLWNDAHFHPNSDYARIIPIPAIILDQLYYFATWAATGANTVYGNFLWYRNVFSQGVGTYNRLNRIGPQLCGSLFATQAQVDAARTFWNAAFASGFTRINAAQGQTALSQYLQLFGFVAQDGTVQLNWFQHTSLVMQKYTQYFNGSVPLKSVSPVGIGAVAVYGDPRGNGPTRNWIYPNENTIEPFLSSRFNALREIPPTLIVQFTHSDHELEEQAEQYAILTHTNMRWSVNLTTQHQWAVINEGNIRSGDYWTMMSFRFSGSISLKTQFAQLIASRYHQQAANRVE
jgi:hypothetical protein